MNDQTMNSMAHARLDDRHREAAAVHLRELSARKPYKCVVRAVVHTYASLARYTSSNACNQRDSN
jgi:hypothetical protein